MGIKASEVVFSTEGLRAMVNGYAREAGVRNLENLIKKILRKLAVKIVRQEMGKEHLAIEKSAKKKKSTASKKKETLPDIQKKYTITSESLNDYLGKPIFTSDRFYERTPAVFAWGWHGLLWAERHFISNRLRCPPKKRP